MAPEESWVGIAEVAAHLRVAKESIYRWVDSKRFPAHRVGRLLRFKLSEVNEWVTASGGDDSGSSPSAEEPRSPRRLPAPRTRQAGTSSGKKNTHG
jgi:excisionase family DNA binding protein